MTGNTGQIDENELQAYVDGQLDEDRRRQIDSALAADSELAGRVETYRAQNEEIRALYGDVARQEIPDRLQPRRIAAKLARRRWLVPLAASLAWLTVGLAGGWLANEYLGDATVADASRHVTSEAVAAHRVYAVEVLHPVEVFADQEEHLVKWLSKRLGHDILAPDLTPLGFVLVGGRLLPAEDGKPAAQFMYEDGGGRRVTVYAVLFNSGKETAFRYQELDGVGSFTWLEPDMGYAIAGDIPREALLEVSKIVYEALEPS